MKEATFMKGTWPSDDTFKHGFYCEYQ